MPSLAHVSDTISRVTSSHDPTISNRVAIGQARFLDGRSGSRQPVPIIAVVSGEAGEWLRLFRVQERQLGWRGDEASPGRVFLSTPYVLNKAECWWTAGLGNIQQVRFAQSGPEAGSWLAIRQVTGTTILRPLYCRHPVIPSGPSRYGQRSVPSRLDPHPVVTISIDQTGDVPHADVTFNPWYQNQIGIIDQRGQWSVWNIEGRRRKRDLRRAVLDCSGALYDGVAASEFAVLDVADGWGAICWVGSIYTLAAFTRRQMALFDLVRRPPVRLETADLALTGTARWILGVRRSPFNDTHIFVLTSSQIFWLEVRGAAAADDDNDRSIDQKRPSACKIILSWIHSRHEEDISLQLEIAGRPDSTLTD